MPDDPTDDTLIARYSQITYSGRGQCTGFTTEMPSQPTFEGNCTFTYDGKGQLVTEAQPDNPVVCESCRET